MTTNKKPGRPPLALTAPAAEPAFDEKAADRKAASAHELASLADEQIANTRLLALTLNYEGSLEPESLIDGARSAMQRANMALFEFGAYLLLLKERVGHGQFAQAVEQLDGMDLRVAQRYMQVTLRFSNASSKTHFARLGKTKLLEMAVLDDEEIQSLAEGGSVRGITLDDADKMSLRQLREAVRGKVGKISDENEDLKAENAALKERLKFANKEARHLQKAAPDEVAANIRGKVEQASMQAQAFILGPIREGLEQLHAYAQQHGLTQEAWMAGQLSNIVLQCKQIAGRVGVQLVDGQHPDWVLAEPVVGRVAGSGAAEFDPNA